MQPVSVVWDNREPGGNPGRSRRCVSISIFGRKAVTVKMGRQKCVNAKSEDLPFYLDL